MNNETIRPTTHIFIGDDGCTGHGVQGVNHITHEYKDAPWFNVTPTGLSGDMDDIDGEIGDIYLDADGNGYMVSRSDGFVEKMEGDDNV